MKPRFDDPATREAFRDRLAGLAEGSHRKSYYPELQERLSELERFRALLDHSTEAIFLAEVPSGALVDVNGSACQQLGRARAELLGQELPAWLEPPQRARLQELLARHGDGDGDVRQTVGASLPRAGGGRFPVEMGVVLVSLEGRAFAVVVARDISEREQMQAQLILADRLVSLGTVAAGVAHEINNPLSYVLGNLEFVDAQLQEVTALCATCSDANHPARPKLEDRLSQAQEALADVRTGAERVQRIVRDLKVFSRAEADQREKVELHDLLDIAVTMTGNEIRHRARLLRRYGEVPPVFANGGRLTQLFINLLVNAAQAIPDGDADRNEIAISTWTEAGDAVVEVSDTGCGIPKEHLSRIFDPFFTTKPTGVGSGLGLSICHGIAVGLGGGMEVQSAPGAGTRMQVRLPGARREALPGPGAAPPRLTAESRRRVLVVDDDPLCVRALQRVLAERDEICPCTSARAALQRLLDGERFDVILCDVMMPDMGGADFYEAVCAQVPEQAGRIVLMTGGAFSAGAQAFLAEGRAPCLEKPFSTPALLAVIDRLSR